MKAEKLAVFFPGIGYHVDKPLLYYSRKLAGSLGYETVNVPYGNFPEGVKNSPEKMRQAFQSALSQTEEILKDVDFTGRRDVLFVSKSVGTAVASAYAGRKGLQVRHIYYTPVGPSFSFMQGPGLVFSGTGDSWVSEDTVREGCEKGGFTLCQIENADHSLETGDVEKDLENLCRIMERTGAYIRGE